MKKFILSIAAIFLVIFLLGCQETRQITSFEACAAAGNPVMESYPRQCRAQGKLFIEKIDSPVSPEDIQQADTPDDFTIDDAMAIAENSECTEKSTLGNKAFYNPNSETWWIDINLKKEGCSPACVVSKETRTAEINWRCTGLIVD